MSAETRVLLSGRVYGKQVGGNTRYVHNVYDRIGRFGVSFKVGETPEPLRTGLRRSAAYAACEGILWPTFPPGDADVLHFPADTGSVVRSRKPVVGTIHGLATLHMQGVRSRASDAIWRFRVRRLARTSDRIITVSNSSAADIAYFEPSAADRIEVIHHGIDHGKFNRVPTGDLARFRAQHTIPEEYFLYAGNLDPRKNVTSLTRAAREVYRATGIPLVVSGAPAWDSDEILNTVRTTPGVVYVGRLSDEDLVCAMQNAVAFCFPSYYEGFGFPVLEAMACGAPVISSKNGSLAEVIGDSALALTSVNSEAIRDAMIHLASDPSERDRLRQAGISNAAKFDWDRSARAHAEVFKSLT